MNFLWFFTCLALSLPVLARDFQSLTSPSFGAFGDDYRQNPYGIRCSCHGNVPSFGVGAGSTTRISATAGLANAKKDCSKPPSSTCLFWRFQHQTQNWRCLRFALVSCYTEGLRKNGCSPGIWMNLIKTGRGNDFEFCLRGENVPEVMDAPLPEVEIPALLYATGLGRIRMVRLLLEKKADVSVTDGEGKSALHVAGANGFANIAKMLADLGGIGVEVRDEVGRTPLWYAAFFDHPEVIEMLAAKGADLEALDSEGVSPMQAAASQGSTAAVRMLAKLGAAAEVTQILGNSLKSGISPLSFAVTGGHEETATALVDAGAEVNFRDVAAAIELDNVRLTRLLMKPFLRRNADDQSAQSLLESAVRAESIQVLKHFAASEDRSLRNVHWKTLLWLSAFNGFEPGLMAILQERRSDLGDLTNTLNKALFYATDGAVKTATKVSILKELKVQGASVTASIDERLCTEPTAFGLGAVKSRPASLLMNAAIAQSYDVYSKIISLGALETDVSPGSNLTAVDFAACCENGGLVYHKLDEFPKRSPDRQALAMQVARVAQRCLARTTLLVALDEMGFIECPAREWQGFFRDSRSYAGANFCQRSRAKAPDTEEERRWMRDAGL